MKAEQLKKIGELILDKYCTNNNFRSDLHSNPILTLEESFPSLCQVISGKEIKLSLTSKIEDVDSIITSTDTMLEIHVPDTEDVELSDHEMEQLSAGVNPFAILRMRHEARRNLMVDELDF